MKKILVFNVGSSSIKYSYFVGKHVSSHNFEQVTNKKQRQKIIQQIAKIVTPDVIGHRIVHGASISHMTKITPSVYKKLQKVAKLAPLHDIPELEVVAFCTKHFSASQYAVFDTAFHQTIPEKNYRYAIPDKTYRKYGFHGISHEYVSKGIKGNVISCHLGSGCSISAIQNGTCLDTTMGFTPLDGIIMSTRPGSLDPGVVLDLVKKKSLEKVTHMFNYDSGLKALGGNADMRKLIQSKQKNAKLAVAIFIEKIVETIGSYTAKMGGVDAIIFTAGIGQRNAKIRKEICSRLSYMGLKIDLGKNRKAVDVYSKISAKGSKITVFVVPTDEQLAIAQKVLKKIKNY